MKPSHLDTWIPDELEEQPEKIADIKPASSEDSKPIDKKTEARLKALGKLRYSIDVMCI